MQKMAETGAWREFETYRLIINERIRPLGIWKCARYFTIPYNMASFVNFIMPEKGILPLCIFSKLCFFGFQVLVLPIFKITLSHVILYYPSRSFYARGAIAMNRTLAQYNRLWELVVLCGLHFYPSVRPSVRLLKKGDTTGRKTNYLRP